MKRANRQERLQSLLILYICIRKGRPPESSRRLISFRLSLTQVDGEVGFLGVHGFQPLSFRAVFVLLRISCRRYSSAEKGDANWALGQMHAKKNTKGANWAVQLSIFCFIFHPHQIRPRMAYRLPGPPLIQTFSFSDQHIVLRRI